MHSAGIGLAARGVSCALIAAPFCKRVRPFMRQLFDKETRMRLYPLCLATVLAFSAQAQATWKPEYASNPPEVRAWYQNAELTDAAKHRFPFKKCCDHSDVVKTKFTVNRTDGGDEWFYEDQPGHWKRIPPDVIHWDQAAPGGKPTLFVYSGKETCFFPGDSGI
jgi:hypothetical protein